MSFPGGSGNGDHHNWGRGSWNQQGSWGQQGSWDQGGASPQYDPLTGRPIERNTAGGHGTQWGEGEFGSQYRGFGVFDQAGKQGAPPPATPRQWAGPRTSRGPLIAALSAVAIVVVVLITTIVVLSGGDGQEPTFEASPATNDLSSTGEPQPTTEPSFSEAPLSEPSGSASGSSTTQAPKTEDVIEPIAPVVPGWQGMGVLEIGIAYDVPPGWKAEPGVVSGFENDSGELAAIRHYSGYKEDFCAKRDVSYRARVGTTDSNNPDPVIAAENAIRKWARLGWKTDDGRAPKIAMNPVETVRIDKGTLGAKLVSATITPAVPGPCGTQKIYLAVVGFPTDGDAALFLGIADQGVPGAVPPAKINRSLTSVRGLPE